MALTPLPTITGTQRKVTATLSASTGPIAVTFPVFGNATDLLVRLDGEDQIGNWSFTSPSGSVATLPKPITDGRVTFTTAVSGLVEIFGRRIPKRTANLPESAAPTVRDFNYLALQTEATLSELFYNGGGDDIGGGSGGPAVDTFNATGSAGYTLSVAPVGENHQVYVSGVYQNKDTYTVSGTTLTFSEAPAAGLVIEVIINGGGGSSSGGGGGGVTLPILSTDVSDFEERVTDIVGDKLVAGTGITITYDDVNGETTITNSASGGSGGPIAASAVAFTPSSGMTATDVQAGLLELNSSKSPLSHTHTSAAITNFNEAVDDRVAALLVAGANVTLTYNDAAGTLTVASTGGGGAGGFVRPEDFGAVGNGVADDTTALQSALRSELPCLLTGYYRITSNITFGTAYSPRGKTVLGSGTKGILCDAAGAGLTWVASTPDIYQEHMLVFHNVVMMCNAVGTGAALHLTTTGGSGATTKTFDIRNVSTFGTTATNRFLYGIRLTNQRGGVIDGCNHQGDRSAAPGSMTSDGVYMDGTGDPVEINIVNNRAYFARSGVIIYGTHEGVTIDKCVTVGTDYGVYMEVDENPVSGDNEGKPLFRVTNGHYNVTVGGVFCVRARDFYIAGNDFLCWSANSNFTGVQATTGGAASQYGYVGGNKFQDATTGSPSAGTTTGVRLNGVSTGGLFTIVGENRYVNLKRGLVLESNARYVKYSAGSIYAACTTNVLDSGSLNEVYGGSGGGGGGGLTDAQLLSRANHTGDEPHATRFAKSTGAEGGEIRLQLPDSTGLSADVAIDVSGSSLRFFEAGGAFRGAALDLASCAGSVSSSIVTGNNIGAFMPLSGVNAIGNFAMLIESATSGGPGGIVDGSTLYYANTAGYGPIVGSGSWRRHGFTSAAGQVTLFQRVA